MTSNKKSCVYVIPFKINSWQLPVRVQVYFAKDFCSSKRIDFCLPKSEMLFARDFEILDSILINKFSDIIIFSELLIAHTNALDILRKYIPKKNNKYTPEFHLTYSDESIDIEELITRIEKIIRNKKFCMTFEKLKEKIYKKTS